MFMASGLAPKRPVQAVTRQRASRAVARFAAPPLHPSTSSVDAEATVLSSFELERERLSAEVAVASVELVSPPEPSITDSALVQWYLRNLEAHPLQTKCWTSFSGFLIGDITAQLLTEPTFVLSRALILAGYGFFVDAPAGNAFYNWLDSNIEPDHPKSAKAVGKKILIDQLIYAPLFTCILYSYLQIANGDAASIPQVLQDKALSTLLANYAVWPLAHALNFYYVPTEQRILYNNFVAVCWTTWLSYLAH